MAENGGIQIQRAKPEDLETVVTLRMEVLREANSLPNNADTTVLEKTCHAYFTRELGGESQVTLLAFAAGRPVGCGSICFYTQMPTCDVPSGLYGTLMNVYTRPSLRGQGVGGRLVKALLGCAAEQGCGCVMLEATEAGRPLYSRYGFIPAKGWMVYGGTLEACEDFV